MGEPASQVPGGDESREASTGCSQAPVSVVVFQGGLGKATRNFKNPRPGLLEVNTQPQV